MQGLRGDRTWYTKERAGVPNLIRVAFGIGKGGSGVRNHIRRVFGTPEGHLRYEIILR